MFDYDQTLYKLRNVNDMSRGKLKRTLFNLVTNEDFLKWVYIPDENKPITENQYNEINNCLIVSRSLDALAEAIEDEDYQIDRAAACYIHTIAETAVDAYNKQCQLLEEDQKNSNISKGNAADMRDKLEVYRKAINRLTRAARKSIRKPVRDLVEVSRLPKGIVRIGYFTVPGQKYLSRNHVGAFLRELLRCIYEEVDGNGFVNPRIVRWRPYFKEIFGKDNIYSVATFILLEGANRVTQYRKNPRAVRECWDSLTDFALDCLNDAPEQIRNQMIELYIKRIDRMFRNHNIDLRVNLLDLSDNWKELRKTVSKYSDRIRSIINRARSQSESSAA